MEMWLGIGLVLIWRLWLELGLTMTLWLFLGLTMGLWLRLGLGIVLQLGPEQGRGVKQGVKRRCGQDWGCD